MRGDHGVGEGNHFHWNLASNNYFAADEKTVFCYTAILDFVNSFRAYGNGRLRRRKRLFGLTRTVDG